MLSGTPPHGRSRSDNYPVNMYHRRARRDPGGGRRDGLGRRRPQDPAVIPQMCCDTVNRGLAYAEGKVILQQADRYMFTG